MRLALVLWLIPTFALSQPAKPVLTIYLPHTVTRPGASGKPPLVRALLLAVSDWDGAAPSVRTLDPEATVSCHKQKSGPGRFVADFHYEAKQPKGPAIAGDVTVHLQINDAVVRGEFKGSFHQLAFHGRAGAGLAYLFDSGASDRGFLLWMAHLRTTVRGVVLFANGADGEARQRAMEGDLQSFAAANQLAIVSTAGLGGPSAAANGETIVNALRELGARSGHREIETVPLFMMGHSAGGGMAVDFNCRLPERVAGYISSHGGGDAKMPQAALANPGIFTAGEIDPKGRPLSIESEFCFLRMAGARVSLVVEEGEQHPMGEGSMAYFLFTFQRLIAQRLPPGATTLQPLDDARAWVADNATWKDGITAIMPAISDGVELRPRLASLSLTLKKNHVDFQPLPLSIRLSWLIDKDVAYVYRGIATYGNRLTLRRSRDHGPAYLAGEAVELECADFGAGPWKYVGLYDGATLLGEVKPRNPRLKLGRQTPGAHAGVLVGETPTGEVRTSLPVLWSVWPE